MEYSMNATIQTRRRVHDGHLHGGYLRREGSGIVGRSFRTGITPAVRIIFGREDAKRREREDAYRGSTR